MSTGERRDLQAIGTFTLAGIDYDVCKQQSENGTIPQIMWIVRAEIVVARVIGLVRYEPRLIEKESGLCWPDELDAEAVASAVRVWTTAGLLHEAVSPT